MFHKTNTILRGVDNISKNYIGINDIVDSTILFKMSEFLAILPINGQKRSLW